MTVRMTVLAVLAGVLWALLRTSVTLPALAVVGLVAWGVVASALAVLLAVDRNRPAPRPVIPGRSYR
jgi:hypothetical protein